MRRMLPLPLLLLWTSAGLVGCDDDPSEAPPVTIAACDDGARPLPVVASQTAAAWLSVWAPTADRATLTGTAAGAGVIAQLVDGRLAIEPTPEGPALWWAWGTEQAVWAVGEAGRILRRAPTSEWEAEASGLGEKAVLWGVWGSGPRDLWAVGGSTRRGGPKAVVLRSAGDGVWRRVTDPLLPVESAVDPLEGRNLYKVWGTGPDDVYLVGEAGLALRWDGARFTPLQGADALLFTVHGQPGGPRYAVGGLEAGRLYAVTRDRLTEVPLGPVNPLNGIAVGADAALAVGARGVMLWGDRAGWCRQRPSAEYATATLHAARLSPTRWAVGGDLTAQTSGVILTDAPIDEVALP